MPEIRKPNRQIGAYGKAKGDFSASIQAEQATANMYDQLTNTALRVSDMAVTNAVNAEIRESALEGEMKGVQATRIEGTEYDKEGNVTKLGSFKGYEKEDEIFKWGVASNKSAKASFEANVNARASSAIKELSETANGNTDLYDDVAKRYMSSTTAELDDERQRDYAVNAWAKYTNQYRANVSADGIQREIKKAKDGWEQGRPTFEEDYGVLLQSISRDKAQTRIARQGGDDKLANELSMKVKKKESTLDKFMKARLAKAEGAVQLGALTLEQVVANTHSDITKAVVTTSKREYNEAQNFEDKARIINNVKALPERAFEDDTNMEQWFMSPRRKEKLLKALDDQELQEQKMWKSERAREDAEYEIVKKELMDDINSQMLDDNMNEKTLEDLGDALELGFIKHKEYGDYRDRLLNGNPVTNDNLTTYAEIETNVEDWDASKIAQRGDLTDGSKRKLISQRARWEEEGKEWMRLPAYTAGRGIIRDSYGFPDKGIMPDFLTHAKRKRYTEMTELEQEYRALVQESVDKGDRYNGVKIAEDLMKNQKEDLTSTLHGKYADIKLIKHKALVEEAKKTGESLNEILKKQIDRNPDTYYDARRGGAPELRPEKAETERERQVRNRKPLSQEEIDEAKALGDSIGVDAVMRQRKEETREETSAERKARIKESVKTMTYEEFEEMLETGKVPNGRN